MSISTVNWTLYSHQETEISFIFLYHWRETNIYKDPYLYAKNHLTLDDTGITIVSFYIKMSKNHQIFGEICTLPKVHIRI